MFFMKNIEKLKKIMQSLRNPETGCPWDIKQTHQSASPYIIEEAYEVIDAIDRKDMVDLRDELGDLLLQVIFHSEIASENGHFDFDDVVDSISNKMLSRHPHVFDNKSDLSQKQIKENWNRIKSEEKLGIAEEKKQKGIDVITTNNMDNAPISNDIAPMSSPALMRGQKISKKAVSYGFEWDNVAGIYDKILEELDEVKTAETHTERTLEIGDVLFSVLNLARHYDIDSEDALRQTNAKFMKRFNNMMTALQHKHPELTAPYDVDLMEKHWQDTKMLDKA